MADTNPTSVGITMPNVRQVGQMGFGVAGEFYQRSIAVRIESNTTMLDRDYPRRDPIVGAIDRAGSR